MLAGSHVRLPAGTDREGSLRGGRRKLSNSKLTGRRLRPSQLFAPISEAVMNLGRVVALRHPGALGRPGRHRVA
jgi:hypothetical protein